MPSNQQYPPVLAGQVLTAGLIQAFAEYASWKSGDTSRTTTTTLTADPDLTLTVPAAGTYRLDGYLDYEGGTGGASDLAISFASVGTLRYHIVYAGAGTGGANVGNTNVGGGTVALRTQGAGVLCGASIKGMIIAPSSGSITLDWAQNTSSGTATIVHAQSWISLRRWA